MAFIIADADRALDILRWGYCHFGRLHFLPNKAGWVGEFAYAYVETSFGPNDHDLIGVKPHVLRVENNWLGLEADIVSYEDVAALVDVIDGKFDSDLADDLSAALRTIGQAYYFPDLEAAFLSMIYAIDAVAGVGRLRGTHQRLWVAAVASEGRVKRFTHLLSDFDNIYSVRNKLVHSGATFGTLELDQASLNSKAEMILKSCIEDIYRGGYKTRSDFVAGMISRITSPEYEAEVGQWLSGVSNPGISVPIADDKTFKKVISQQTTDF